MKRIKGKISGRNAFINDADKKDWLTMQEWFATKPFYELLSLDDILDYYKEFQDGGIYCANIEYEEGHSYPVSLISWKGAKETEHPITFEDISKVSYISDSMTIPSYRKRGLQANLMLYALREMKKNGYEYVYLRTVEESEMNTLAKKAGMNLCMKDNKVIKQITKTPRSIQYIEELNSVSKKKLFNLVKKLVLQYDEVEKEKIADIMPNKKGIMNLLEMLNDLEIKSQDKSFQIKFGKNISETSDQVMIPEIRCFYEGSIQIMILKLGRMLASYNKTKISK